MCMENRNEQKQNTYGTKGFVTNNSPVFPFAPLGLSPAMDLLKISKIERL